VAPVGQCEGAPLNRSRSSHSLNVQPTLNPKAAISEPSLKRAQSLGPRASASAGTFKSRLKKERLAEILEAARVLLLERGYDAFTLDELAWRVRCSKTTLYRRWCNKSDVIVEVMGARILDAEPDTGSLRGDLEELVSRIAGGMEQGVIGETFLAVALALRREEELRQAWKKFGLLPGKQRLERIIERAIARGEISVRPNLTLLNSILPGTFIWAWHVERPDDREAFCRDFLEDVLLPLMHGHVRSEKDAACDSCR
jgi:AcrR family transcriptional regulator